VARFVFWAILAGLTVSTLNRAGAAAVALLDFEQGSPSCYILDGASVTDDPSRVLEGKRGVQADLSGSDTEWNEFFRTTPEVRFQPGRTYHVSFRYRILDPGGKDTRFYSLLRSRSGGDLYGHHWLWTREKGGEGVIHRLFQVKEKSDWELIVGIRHRGAILLDSVSVYECDRDVPGYSLPVKSAGSSVPQASRRIDALRRKEGLSPTLADMLVVWCNEGAGAKISADPPRGSFAAQHDPDFVDWNPCGPMAKEFGVRTSRGGPEYQEFYKVEGAEVWESRYEKFGGNGFAESLDGTFIQNETWGEGGYFTCQIAPGWHGWFTDELLKATSNHLAVCQDNISCAPFNTGYGCFCPHCLAGFRGWLGSRYTASELRAFGIDDLPAFDYRERVCRYGLLGERAQGDPLTREYIKFQYAAQLLAWADVVERVKAAGAQKGLAIPVCGNQIGTFGMWPYASIISQFCDIVEIEEVITVGSDIPDWGVQYKMGRAGCHEERPVWVRGPVYAQGKDRTPQMSQLFWASHFGEALANGGVRDISFGMNAPWTGDPDTLDFIDSPEIQQVWRDYSSFCHDNRAILTRRESMARVALIYSLPTMMFRRYYPQQIDENAVFDEFHQAALWLDRSHIPYDCVIFGHPELFLTDVARLSRYDALVLPAAESLSDTQVDLLKRFAARGGTIIADGRLGIRDENDNVRSTAPLAGLRILDLKNDRSAAVEAMRGVTPLSVQGPDWISANVWRSAGGASLDVHLVNYGADLDAGVWKPLEQMTVEAELPAGMRFDSVQLLRFGASPRSLEFRRVGDRVRFAVPPFEAYAVVSICDSAAVLRENSDAARRRAVDRDAVRKLAVEKDLY